MYNITNSSSYQFQESKWMLIGLYSTSSITFTIGFPVNVIIINFVARHDSLKNPTNFFVSSLAVADLLVLLWMMIWIIGTQVFAPTILSRYIYSSLDIFLGIASMVNVACVSMDRAIAVTNPLTYENVMTKRRSFIAILCCWIFSLTVLVGALLRYKFRNQLYNKVILYVGFTSYFVPALIIIISYAIILLIIVHKLQGFRELERVISNARVTVDDQNGSKKRRRRRRKLLRELKVTANLLLIVVPFTVGWTFFIGTHLYETVNKVKTYNAEHNFVIIIIPWILSGLNPILYLLLNRTLRRAFLSSFKKLFQFNKYPFEESKSSFFASLSKGASLVFRRTSASTDDGNGFLHASKMMFRRRNSHGCHSRLSCDANIHDVANELLREPAEKELVQCANMRAVVIELPPQPVEKELVQYSSVV